MHQNNSRLPTGHVTRKIKAIARFFIHDFICTRPVHGSCRIGGVLIFISEIRSWLSTRFSGIAPEDRRDLLTVHRIGSSKPTVVAAGDDAILIARRIASVYQTPSATSVKGFSAATAGAPAMRYRTAASIEWVKDAFGANVVPLTPTMIPCSRQYTAASAYHASGPRR